MVTIRLKGPPSLVSVFPLLIKSLTCHRTMVNKIWCRKVARTWLQAKSKVPHARVFTEPNCQNYICGWFIVYRFAILFAWLLIAVCSIFELGSVQPLGSTHKWPIYLTNWDLTIGTLQAGLAIWLVRKRWKLQNTVDFDPANLTIGKIEKVYWFLYTSTCTIAIAVSVSYWCAVHDPKIHHLDALNIMLHVCNSILMIIDLCVMNIPIKLRHFWWSLGIVVMYLLFTVIYYFAGGLDKRGYTYIYKVLDWARPVRSLLVCLGGLTFLVIVHCLLCLLTTMRERSHAKSTDNYTREPTSNSQTEQCTIKHVEIV